MRKTMQAAILAMGLALLPAIAMAESNVYELGVDGLGCPFCAYGIEKTLGEVDGVDRVDVDMKRGVVVVTIAAGADLDRDTARQAVEDAGFDLRSFAPAAEE